MGTWAIVKINRLPNKPRYFHTINNGYPRYVFRDIAIYSYLHEKDQAFADMAFEDWDEEVSSKAERELLENAWSYVYELDYPNICVKQGDNSRGIQNDGYVYKVIFGGTCQDFIFNCLKDLKSLY